MIISEKLKKELVFLGESIGSVLQKYSLTDLQTENFLNVLEKTRYNILNELKIYNNNVECEYEKIKTIDNKYKAIFENNILKIYVPEIMPSYKNQKTHSHKRILLNVAEVTKRFHGLFEDKVFIYIKIFDNIVNWDVDNKYIKPIADALILSKVIEDDNINKMFYCVNGGYSEDPHTEIYVFDAQNINDFLAQYSS